MRASEKVVPIHIDPTRDRETALKFKVQWVPDLRFLDAGGNEIKQYAGEPTGAALAAEIEAIVAGAPPPNVPRNREPRKIEQTLELITLKNGNKLKGTLVAVNSEELILMTKAGRIGIRKEYIAKREAFKETVVIPPVPDVERSAVDLRPAVKQPEVPVKPERTSVKPVKTATTLSEKIDQWLDRLRTSPVEQHEKIRAEIATTGEEGHEYLASVIDKNEDICETIGTLLATMPESSGLPRLLEKLDGGSPRVKAVAIKVLGVRRYERVLERILELMDDKDDAVREACLDALASMGATGQIRQVIRKLNDPSEMVARRAQAVAESLGSRPEAQEEAADELLNVLYRGSTRAQALAARLAGVLHVRSAIPRLTELINDDDREVRSCAIMALGELKVTETLEPLTNRLSIETDGWVKIQIIQAFQNIRDRQAVPTLIDLLEDPDEQVRHRASVALTNITGQAFGEDRQKWLEWWNPK